MIGVAAFAYGALHLTLFAADKLFDLDVVVSEILLRRNLVIGAWALLLLMMLAATSTDGMMRRLGGKNWRNLHRFAYAAAVLASTHFFMQSKLNASEPTVVAGLLAWLLAWRVARPTGAAGLALLAVAVGLGTALAEAAYYGLFTGVDPWRVLEANVALFGRRPAGVVLLAGFAVVLAAGIASVWRALSARPILSRRKRRAKVRGPVPEVP